MKIRIHGPYTRKDGRKHICIVHDDGRKQTKSWPRYLMEQHLGRELLPEETVDHIDEDFTNDAIENLQILSLSENAKKSAATRPSRDMYAFICPACGCNSIKPNNHVKNNRRRGKSGPYCSRRCAGKFRYKNPWDKREEWFVPVAVKRELEKDLGT